MTYSADRPKSRPLPGLAGLRTALRQLVGGDDSSPVGLSAVYYPLVGLFLGAGMVAVDLMARNAGAPALSGWAVVGFHALVTRGRPLRGSARTTVRFVSVRSKDSEVVPVLLQAAYFVLGVWLVGRIDVGRLPALLFAPMLARCAMVVMATGSRQARGDERLMKFAPELTFREFGVASTAAFALVFLTTDFFGFLLVLVTGVTTVALRLALHWRLGGVDRDSLHATGEIVQLAVLGLTAAF